MAPVLPRIMSVSVLTAVKAVQRLTLNAAKDTHVTAKINFTHDSKVTITTKKLMLAKSDLNYSNATT